MLGEKKSLETRAVELVRAKKFWLNMAIELKELLQDFAEEYQLEKLKEELKK